MTRLPIAIAMLAGSLSLATAARAADDQTAADVRCLAVAFGMLQSPDPQVKSIAIGASLYFVGRLRGRTPDLDLEAAMVQQVGRMPPEDVRDELQRCSGVLQDEGGKLKAIAEDLKKRADDAAAPPARPAGPAPK
jgi:hypothetical protein